MARALSEYLGASGFDCRVAGRVNGALAAMREMRPALAILDVELPDGDGFSVCRELRAEPALARTPVIFLTSHAGVEDRLRGFEAGAQDYVPKPVSLPELLARVRAQLGVREADAADVEEQALRSRLRRDLLDYVVHDLKSPLATIRLTLDLVAASGLVTDAQYRKLLESAGTAADFAVLLVNDLLDLDCGIRMEFQDLELEPLLERLRLMLGPQAEKRGVAFQVAAAAVPPGFRTDPTLVFRIIANLALNAIKFSGRGAHVAVLPAFSEGRLRIDVLDDGPGVPASEKARIFERGFRGANAASSPGSGLGLAFCRAAVAALGGKVRMEDGTEGKGSRFVLEIPPAGRTVDFEELLGADVMREYREICRSLLVDARAALTGGKLEEVRAIAHKLTGSAGTYGFPQASAIARALETSLLAAAAGSQPPAARVDRMLSELERELGLSS